MELSMVRLPSVQRKLWTSTRKLHRPVKELRHGHYDGQHSRAHARASGFSPGRLDKPPRANQLWSIPYNRPGNQSDGHHDNTFHKHWNLQTVHYDQQAPHTLGRSPSPATLTQSKFDLDEKNYKLVLALEHIHYIQE